VEKGRRIGEGRTAEVFEWGEGKVLKLYRDWCPPDWARHEAEVTRAVHAAGAPAPAIGYVVEVDGRPGIVCERLDGRPLRDQLAGAPWRAGAGGTSLARLHHLIHEKRAAPGRLPRLREKVTRAIVAAGEILGQDGSRALAALAALPDGDALCHYDFHPDNVLGEGDAARIIDWGNGCVGPPAADVARTLLILRSPYLPDDFPAALRPFAAGARRWLAAAYASEYRRLSGLKQAEIDAWLSPIAAARLWENVPGEREWLLGMVRGGLGEA
jgi:Ser/Thr protein kinase RdoA (MazF antagonist)